MNNRRVGPPLGVLPRFLWDEDNPAPLADVVGRRFRDVLEAKIRYIEANFPHPDKWDVEINDRMEQFAKLLGLPRFGGIVMGIAEDDAKPDHIISKEPA